MNSFDIVFSFGHSEDSFAEEVKSICKDLFGTDARISKEKTALKVYVLGSPIALLFRHLCGSDRGTRKVPFFLFNSPTEIVGAFLLGYFDGDGRYKKGYSDAVTVSKSLAMGIFELLLDQGVVPAFYRYVPHKQGLLCGRV